MKRTASWLLPVLLALGRVGLAAVRQVPDPYPLIQAALDACVDGDTVLVAPGHYHERLQIPNHDLTLGSQTLLTGDTLFIRQTILDGDSLGRVIWARSGGQNRFILDGFTIRGGIGQQAYGAGIDIQDNSDVVLRNLFFEQNNSTWDGACIYIGPGPTRAELRNIQGRDNHSSGAVLKLISVYVERTAILDGLRFDSLACGLLSFASGTDTCVVRNVFSSNSTSKTMISAGMSDATVNSYQEYVNINVSSTQWRDSRLMVLGGSGPATLKNIRLVDNVRIGDRDQYGEMLYSINRGRLQIDSLVFRRNRGAVSGATGGVLKSWAFPPDYEPVHGVIRNLVMEDNVLGDSTHTEWDSSINYPSMLTTEGYCIDGAMVSDNTVILTPGPDSPAWGVMEANLIRIDSQVTDSFTLRNMRFENNLVIDLDDNDALSSHWANEGRCLRIEPNGYDFFLVDSLVFDRNLVSSLFTELPYGGSFGDDVDVGSVFQIRSTLPLVGEPPKQFRNLVFVGNQDGGLRAKDEGDLRLSNVQLIDMHRQGLDLQAQRVELDNVLVDGCEPYAALASYSEQMPLRLEVTDSSLVRNCTILNCTTPYVVMAGLRLPDSPPGPVVRFENCLFAGNEYDRFEALIVNYTDTPGWNPYVSGEFTHCLLQEEPDVGADNLIGVDPRFDPAWGVPYLAADSPCIDAGDPDAASNDVEDPANPGFALWPSQGSVRNDIGVTGGPRAAVIDTNWVGIKPNQRESRPQSFTLGNPYPNPFNPIARIPFSLDRARKVELRLYNLRGQEVGQLGNPVTNHYSAGLHELIVDGRALASGIYFAEVRAGDERAVARIVLLK
jgi:hypothetical protein